MARRDMTGRDGDENDRDNDSDNDSHSVYSVYSVYLPRLPHHIHCLPRLCAHSRRGVALLGQALLVSAVDLVHNVPQLLLLFLQGGVVHGSPVEEEVWPLDPDRLGQEPTRRIHQACHSCHLI